MVAKFLILSILDLFLGINFLSPIVLVQNSLGKSEVVYLDPKDQNVPFLLPTVETNYFPIRDWEIPDPELTARSAILYDLSSEKILFGVSPEIKLPIASLTKLMAAIVVFENMSLDDVVGIKKSAIDKSTKEGGGNDLYEGEKIKALDLLKLMLIESSNVGAYAFVEHLEEKYQINLVEKMNEKAKILEMDDTLFTEAAGLDDKESFSTSQDLIKLVKYSFRYGSLYDILKTQKAEVASIDGSLRHQILNTNQLLGRLLNIIGGKTGFTELAGGSIVLVTEAPINSSRLITVVLGSNDRFGDAKKLVEWAAKAYLWR
ncbi:MAG: D-alanyl-D-alanine carboxypeptidase [Parcubacteria group bacterium Gr01-1014_2]|nr:MAG: D-alanyl-D-alanine carboxypeptidase [Parcubacteria group bacterium Gr01-1014_2]